jgi:hypothetical protein
MAVKHVILCFLSAPPGTCFASVWRETLLVADRESRWPVGRVPAAVVPRVRTCAHFSFPAARNLLKGKEKVVALTGVRRDEPACCWE